MLERVRIVLVEPTGPANVGAVCRGMANLGFSELVLVAPRCELMHPEAVGFAANAGHVLRSARVVDSIPPALSGCVKTFAATSKAGLYRRQAALSAERAARRAIELLPEGPCTFVFGPERTGLTTPELMHFDYVVTIPTDEAYPALNLASAVVIVCYELRRAWLASGEAAPPAAARGEPLASDERKQILFERLFDALERVGFFRGQQSPEHLRLALRRVLGRADLTVNEADILIGMAQQIRWYTEHRSR